MVTVASTPATQRAQHTSQSAPLPSSLCLMILAPHLDVAIVTHATPMWFTHVCTRVGSPHSWREPPSPHLAQGLCPTMRLLLAICR